MRKMKPTDLLSTTILLINSLTLLLSFNSSAYSEDIFSTITGRHIFYNNSAFDGNNAEANEQDDNAIATDKQALLPGETASFTNYTSYSRGINGIMIDIKDMANTDDLTLANLRNYFEFRVGNDNNPEGWTPAPNPYIVTVRPTPNTTDTQRVTLIWDDNVIQKQWIQVRILANTYTGLSRDDLFYFGNAIGESGQIPGNTFVNIVDELDARNNATPFLQRAAIDDPFDYNRDRFVNIVDELIARNNMTPFLKELRLITVVVIDTTPPILYWTGEYGYANDGVNPDAGFGTTDFQFRIRCSDNSNEAPPIHKLYIDKNGDGDFDDPNEVSEMIPEGDDYISGVIYYYTTTIPYSEAGNNLKYYFEFSDGLNVAEGEILRGYSPQTAMNGPVVSQVLSISISPNTWNIGELQIGTTATMEDKDKITVSNTGDGPEDLALSITGVSHWASGANPAAETFVLNAAFSKDPDNIIWNEEDHLVTTEPTTSTELRFAGDESGVDISPNETRNLFLQFKSPTRTQTLDPQSITLTISAEIPAR